MLTASDSLFKVRVLLASHINPLQHGRVTGGQADKRTSGQEVIGAMPNDLIYMSHPSMAILLGYGLLRLFFP
jgi:hypothetical protein